MASLKYDLPLLDRETRFSLWQVKMRAVLAHTDLDDALERFDDLKGYKYSAEGGVLKVSRGSLVVMKGDMKSANLYLLRGTTITGYKSGVKGYKLWNPETRKVVISRNVVFNEPPMLHDTLANTPLGSNEKSSVQVEHFVDAQRKEIDSVPNEPISEDSSVVEDVPIVSRFSPPPQRSIGVDRTRRQPKPVRRLIEECNIAYALSVAEEIEGWLAGGLNTLSVVHCVTKKKRYSPLAFLHGLCGSLS
ncbi:hypothetical protein U9M48_042955 [Paspalum notatum var. saurae]|uniref:Retroviral polymerase SH3-like domain-containing protein n=1 Tax=Paspalum notatum var. saurae TaxID=547442 RepID=A0AAQ3UW96_PASNO